MIEYLLSNLVDLKSRVRKLDPVHLPWVGQPINWLKWEKIIFGWEPRPPLQSSTTWAATNADKCQKMINGSNSLHLFPILASIDIRSYNGNVLASVLLPPSPTLNRYWWTVDNKPFPFFANVRIKTVLCDFVRPANTKPFFSHYIYVAKKTVCCPSYGKRLACNTGFDPSDTLCLLSGISI